MGGEGMPISKKVRNEKYINLRISTKEFFHLGNYLFEQINVYQTKDNEGKGAYNKKQMEALDAVFRRMKQISGV